MSGTVLLQELRGKVLTWGLVLARQFPTQTSVLQSPCWLQLLF